MGGSKNNKSNNDNSDAKNAIAAQAAQNAALESKMAEMRKQQAKQAKLFEQKQEQQKSDDLAKQKAKEEENRNAAISSESSRARELSTSNQNQIGAQLSQSLATPMQQNATAVQAGYTPSGFALGNQMKSVPGNVGGFSPSETTSTMPSALIAQKINQDSGGTNQQQNRFTIPKTEGLVFGGT